MHVHCWAIKSVEKHKDQLKFHHPVTIMCCCGRVSVATLHCIRKLDSSLSSVGQINTGYRAVCQVGLGGATHGATAYKNESGGSLRECLSGFLGMEMSSRRWTWRSVSPHCRPPLHLCFHDRNVYAYIWVIKKMDLYFRFSPQNKGVCAFLLWW